MPQGKVTQHLLFTAGSQTGVQLGAAGIQQQGAGVAEISITGGIQSNNLCIPIFPLLCICPQAGEDNSSRAAGPTAPQGAEVGDASWDSDICLHKLLGFQAFLANEIPPLLQKKARAGAMPTFLLPGPR